MEIDLYRVGQLISSTLGLLDELDEENLRMFDLAVSPLFPPDRMKVKAFSQMTTRQVNSNLVWLMQMSNASKNVTSLALQKELNRYAHLRAHLMDLLSNGSLDTPLDVIFHTSMVAQLTQRTHQLTRSTSVQSLTIEKASIVSLKVLAWKKCSQLVEDLQSLTDQLAFEALQSIISDLLQSMMNVLTVSALLWREKNWSSGEKLR